jgi:flavin reductase (DIM6/NTAB) family NADH-FMN oxidoreductase RutF
MNITSIEFDYGINELEQAGLTPLPSVRVRPPRIGESPVAMECELMQIIDWGESGLVLGRVVAMHVRDDVVVDAASHYIDTPKLKLLGRMHGRGWYARTSDLFEMPRIPVSDWKMKPSRASGPAEKLPR